MKLLLFSDLHGDISATRALVARASEFDVLVGAGDFCNARRGLEAAVAPFLFLRTPMVFVAGNNETPDELRRACQSAPLTSMFCTETLAVLENKFSSV